MYGHNKYKEILNMMSKIINMYGIKMQGGQNLFKIKRSINLKQPYMCVYIYFNLIVTTNQNSVIDTYTQKKKEIQV